MRLPSACLALLAILLIGPAYATVAAPDPARLAADWWTYFAPAEALDDATLQQRVADTDGLLEKLQTELDPERRAEVLPGIVRLRELLASYAASRGQQAALPEALSPPLEQYSLEQAFERHHALTSRSAEIRNQQDEATWQRDLLVAERKQQSRDKVAYLERPETDPERLQAGLALMASRARIELDALSLERREAVLDQLLAQQSDLKKEVEAISGRLVMKPDEIEVWGRVRETALDEVISLQDDEAVEPSEGARRVVDARQARVDALRILQRDLRVKKAELLAARAELMEELIRFATTKDGSPDVLRELIDKSEDSLEALRLRQEYWKNAADRVQKTLLDADAEAETAPQAADRAIAEESRRLIGAVQKLNAAVGLESDRLAFAARLAERRIRVGESVVERGWGETIDFFGASLEGAHTMLSASLFEINETPVTLFGLLRVLFFLTLAWLLSKGVRRGLESLAERNVTVSQSSLYALGRVFHYAILGIGIVIGLSSIGIDFTKFALLASALGIGIGFGMQALVSNFVAGLIILFEKSLKVGDFVELQSGITGEVKEINMRSTLVTTNDNVDILVPNSDFINQEVTNWTLREAYRRIHVPFGVAYGTDKERVRKAVLEAADAVTWTLKESRRRAPQVWFVNFGESSLDFELVVWLIPEAVKRPSAVQAAYLWEIESKLHEYRIEVPFPQRDLHLRSGFTAPGPDGHAAADPKAG
ncbi:MAG: mechanosensitive ion channel domain-containing protein [Sedimenticolaceae bacterium]